MKPLEGVRILAVSQYGAGPYAMLHLADLGAEIIKIEDPHTQVQSFASRLEHRDILIEALMVCFRKEDTAFWLAKLSGQVPAAAVSSVEEAMQHPLLKERKMIVDVPHPRYGSLRMMGNPIKVSDSETTYEAGPALGAHNREVFGEILGLGEDELRQLQAEGTI